MSKAEKFIEYNTKLYSNVSADRTMTPWLTPEQARKAVEIAKEEVYEWLEMNISDYIVEHHLLFPPHLDAEFETDKMVKDLKQAIKDE